MTSQGAEKAITTSALIVAGIYTYRRLTEGNGTPSGSKAAQLLGRGSPPSVGVFITAWGTAYLVMAIMATISPGLGGSFAILAAAADILSNGQQVSKDVNTKIGASTSTASSATVTPATPQSIATYRLTHPPAPLTLTPTTSLTPIP